MFFQLRGNNILGGKTTFFGSRKNKKLEEESRKKEQQRLEEEAAKKAHEYHVACDENKKIFVDTICHMVRSLPKKRQIVVVQRKNTFNSKESRNYCYLDMANRMSREYRRCKRTWISGYDDSLYAFYAPTKLTPEFEWAIKNLSKGGYRIQHIRYYPPSI